MYTYLTTDFNSKCIFKGTKKEGRQKFMKLKLIGISKKIKNKKKILITFRKLQQCPNLV